MEYSRITFKSSEKDYNNTQMKKQYVQDFIKNNNLRKLENHSYPIYLDTSKYYINDKNEVYRISTTFGEIHSGPHTKNYTF
jgi:hypothetical protein